MKKLFTVLIMLISFMIFIATAGAQENIKKETKLSSVSLSSGQGPLSSGLLLEANFNRGNDVINLTLGERDLYASYLKSTLNKKLLVGPCLEYFHNVPTLSGIAIFFPIKNVSAFSWLGYSAGAPDCKVELTKWRFLFFYQSLDYTMKRFTATGAMMYFDGWQPMVDLKYQQPITKEIIFFTSAGYNFFKEGTALLKIGVTYKL
ncbi:MAG: hypothetical protein ACYC40_00580 [Patescibacteria group bacterium]